MVALKDGPRTTFIAGYHDLTQEEFREHYAEDIDDAINDRHNFTLSDEPGASALAFEYLLSRGVSRSKITIHKRSQDDELYLSTTAGIHQNITNTSSDTDHYSSIAEDCEDSIIWLRPVDSLEDHGCISGGDTLDFRFTGPKEALRVMWANAISSCMRMYDELV